jgi:hypothetical protein
MSSTNTNSIDSNIIDDAHGSIKEKTQSILEIMPFDQCFYGCRLDKLSYNWECKKFYSVEEADSFAFQNKNSTLATRLIPVSCIGTNLPNFWQSYRLYNHVNFPVKIVKTSTKAQHNTDSN